MHEMFNFCSLMFNLSLEKPQSGFLLLKLSKICLNSWRKKSHNLHNFSRNRLLTAKDVGDFLEVWFLYLPSKIVVQFFCRVVICFPLQIADLANEDTPQLFAACGRGPRSSMRVLRHGLEVRHEQTCNETNLSICKSTFWSGLQEIERHHNSCWCTHVHFSVLLYACGYFTVCFLSVRFLKWPCQNYQVIPMRFGRWKHIHKVTTLYVFLWK